MAHSISQAEESAQTDEQLALLAQSGDASAERILLSRMRPTVQSIASHFAGAALEQEDLIQEGLLALLSAVYAFRPEKAASLRTFAAVCISNRLRSVVRENASPKNAPLNGYVPLDTLEIADYSDPFHQVISDETVDEWFRIFENDLSSLENSVLQYFLKGYSYGEIARILQITEKAADNALQRIRKKLKAKKTTD